MTEIWAAIAQSIIAAVAVALTTLVGVLVRMAIKAFEARTNILFTNQQQAEILTAATTEVGLVETKLDQGLLKISDIHPTSPAIVQHAITAMDRMSTETALATTPSIVAAMIAGGVDTSPPARPVVLVPPSAPSIPRSA